MRSLFLSSLLLTQSSAAPIDAIMGASPANGKYHHEPTGGSKKADCNLDDLADVSKCKTLWLTGAPSLTPEHIDTLVKQLETDTSLESLVIQKASWLGDKGAIRMAEIVGKNTTALHSLALMDCGIGDEGAYAIAKMMNTSGVERLQLAGNSGITLAGAESLASAHEAMGVFNTIPIGKYNRGELTVIRVHDYDIDIMEATVLKALMSGENAITNIELGGYGHDGQVMEWLGLLEDEDEKDEL